MSIEFPKHEPNDSPKGKKKKPQPAIHALTVPTEHRHEIDFVAELSGIEMALEKMAHTLSSAHANLCDGHLSLGLHTGPSGSGYYPVLVEFEGETQEVLGRIATAFERIAAVLEGKAT